MDALREISGRYDVADFDLECLQEHIDHDIQLLKKTQDLVKPITPDKDDKLQTLKKWLKKKPLERWQTADLHPIRRHSTLSIR